MTENANGGRPASKPLIGLVGGIGSGKSTVARLFAESGAAVIESDALNRAQLRSPEVLAELRSWWGDTVLDADGQVDKRRLAERIFGDVSDRHRLEALLHPRIAAERDRLIDEYQRDPGVWGIVLDTPLLMESGLDRRCDTVVFVDADDAVRRGRVIEHRGWSTEEWVLREKSQNALDKKRSRADHVVANNSTDLAALRNDVMKLITLLTQKFN